MLTTINGKIFKKFEIISYDVWGNTKDGFYVNQSFHTNTIIFLAADCTDADIIREIKNAGFLKKSFQFKSFRIDGEFDYSLYVEHNRLGPVCELRAVEESENK